MNATKFYIPGETKEIEALRRRALLNGVILIADILVETCPNETVVQRIKRELIDNFNTGDFKVHFYAILASFKGKLEGEGG